MNGEKVATYHLRDRQLPKRGHGMWSMSTYMWSRAGPSRGTSFDYCEGGDKKERTFQERDAPRAQIGLHALVVALTSVRVVHDESPISKKLAKLLHRFFLRRRHLRWIVVPALLPAPPRTWPCRYSPPASCSSGSGTPSRLRPRAQRPHPA